ncbi:FecCD family ABC transporter permease [Desulfotalea psychrophila]|uniref:Probable Fe(III) ABC-transporter, permease protein n=1 Tax=Desulfotalea psychrophila (strain LSv54 / DSM 12343) TaxID=177439 RepID=Q6ART1_DESPS|nr:iron ABC transporter permease [Desulfotalea psychrophila]CAG34944.1 probable Fe(III) ABC-transporter, permease protein [Desulfotalea psychrophila LSv54]
MPHPFSAKGPLLPLILILLALLCMVGSAGMGYINISASDIIHIIASKISGDSTLLTGIEPSLPYVIMDIRLPRILCAFLVGAGLAISGVIYQGILLNPLADPYTLGVSSGAAFGAALALLANMALLPLSLPLCAFGGALITLFIVIRLSSFGGQISAGTLILSGVIIGAILSAGISFIKYLADEQVSAIIFWLMGSFVARGWSDVAVILASLVPGLAIALYYSRDLNIIATGNRASASLGVETARVRKILLITASLITAVCVSATGIIGFIGLIVPHLMRIVVGPDNRKLLPVSFLAGGILLLVADTVTRAVLPVEIPIGILTALIGGPVFCLIFRKRQRGLRYGN